MLLATYKDVDARGYVLCCEMPLEFGTPLPSHEQPLDFSTLSVVITGNGEQCPVLYPQFLDLLTSW